MGSFNVKAAYEGVAEISDLGKVVFPGLVGSILSFAGITFFILLVIGGFKYLTSGGDPKAAEGAKKTFTSAIIGLLVILLAYIILLIIGNVTGVDVSKFSIQLPS